MKFDFGIDMQVKAKQAMQAISTNLQALGFTLNTCSGPQAVRQAAGLESSLDRWSTTRHMLLQAFGFGVD
jgi:hypothetical protein